MASSPTSGRRKRRLALVFLAVAYVPACQAVYWLLSSGPSGPTFPHATHIEQGLECTQCHPGAEEKARAGFPENTNACMLCHTEIDAKKPPEERISAFLVDGKPRWLLRPDHYAGDVRFDHSKHYDADVECESCHISQVGEGEGKDIRIHGGKRECLACHETKTKRGKDCSVCHKRMRKDEPPPSHSATWIVLHGRFSREQIAGLGQTTCAQCHNESTCTHCHHEQKPSSHTNMWRRRGHGLAASIDRSKCATCHRPDFCNRCHSSTRPMSHRGAFGAPLNRHCVTCHLPPIGLSCSTCHRSLPVHPAGPPRPGNAAHQTASSPTDCLNCHLVLKHGNPGGNCLQCHR